MSDSQHKPAFANHPGYGFDDDGEPVPFARADAGADPQTASPLLGVCLEFITRATTPAEIGQRAILLSEVLNPTSHRTLGSRLGVSHVTAGNRLSKFRAELRGELADFEP